MVHRLPFILDFLWQTQALRIRSRIEELPAMKDFKVCLPLSAQPTLTISWSGIRYFGPWDRETPCHKFNKMVLGTKEYRRPLHRWGSLSETCSLHRNCEIAGGVQGRGYHVLVIRRWDGTEYCLSRASAKFHCAQIFQGVRRSLLSCLALIVWWTGLAISVRLV